jgi:hypothetical protein
MSKKKKKKSDTPNALPVREGTEEIGKDAVTTDYNANKKNKS